MAFKKVFTLWRQASELTTGRGFFAISASGLSNWQKSGLMHSLTETEQRREWRLPIHHIRAWKTRYCMMYNKNLSFKGFMHRHSAWHHLRQHTSRGRGSAKEPGVDCCQLSLLRYSDIQQDCDFIWFALLRLRHSTTSVKDIFMQPLHCMCQDLQIALFILVFSENLSFWLRKFFHFGVSKILPLKKCIQILNCETVRGFFPYG